MDGWIKLHRKVFDSAVNTLPAEQKWVMVTILLLASHTKKKWMWKGKEYECQPGEFITSLESLSFKAGVSKQTVRTALKNLEKLNFLTNESTKTGRLIKIEKWAFYQGDGEEPNKVINKELTNNQQTINKELTPIKKERKKEGKKERSSSRSNNKLTNNNQVSSHHHHSLNPSLIEHFKDCGFYASDSAIKSLDNLVKLYGEEWCIQAMDRCVLRGKISIGYMQGILKNWKSNGGIDPGEGGKAEKKSKKDIEGKIAYLKRSIGEKLGALEASDAGVLNLPDEARKQINNEIDEIKKKIRGLQNELNALDKPGWQKRRGGEGGTV